MFTDCMFHESGRVSTVIRTVLIITANLVCTSILLLLIFSQNFKSNAWGSKTSHECPFGVSVLTQ